MNCCSTYNLLRLLQWHICCLVVDGGEWTEVKMDKQNNEQTKHEANYDLRVVQCYCWSGSHCSMLAMKLKSAVLIWCIETWEFLTVAVGEMIQWKVDITMQHTEPDKSRGTQKSGTMSRKQLTNLQKSGFSCLELVYAAELAKFLLWKSLFICHWLWWLFLSDFVTQHQFTTFSQVSSVLESL